MFPVGANCFSNATRLLNIANLFRKVVLMTVPRRWCKSFDTLPLRKVLVVPAL